MKEISQVEKYAQCTVKDWNEHIHRILHTGVEYPIWNPTPINDIFCNIPEYMSAREVSTTALEESLMSYLAVLKNSAQVKDVFVRLFVSLAYYKSLSSRTIDFLIDCLKSKNIQHILVPHKKSSLSALAARIMGPQILTDKQREDVESYLKSHLRHKLGDPLWWIAYVKFVVGQYPFSFDRQYKALGHVIDEFVEKEGITDLEKNTIADLAGYIYWRASEDGTQEVCNEQYKDWYTNMLRVNGPKFTPTFGHIIWAVDVQYKLDRKNIAVQGSMPIPKVNKNKI